MTGRPREAHCARKQTLSRGLPVVGNRRTSMTVQSTYISSRQLVRSPPNPQAATKRQSHGTHPVNTPDRSSWRAAAGSCTAQQAGRAMIDHIVSISGHSKCAQQGPPSIPSCSGTACGQQAAALGGHTTTPRSGRTAGTCAERWSASAAHSHGVIMPHTGMPTGRNATLTHDAADADQLVPGCQQGRHIAAQEKGSRNSR